MSFALLSRLLKLGWARITLVPPMVWLALAGAAALLYYGHWNYSRGEAVGMARAQAVAQEKRAELEAGYRQAAAAATARAIELDEIWDQREKDMDNAIQSAQQAKGASDVCLPSDVVDRLRAIR